MRQNVLEVLGIAGKEDVISNLLKHCVEESTSFRRIFLEQICGLRADAYSDCEVFTRLQMPTGSVPDLVIVCRGQVTDWVIIENKLKAEEGTDQTVRYADTTTVGKLSRQLELSTSAGQPSFVFLTLFPDQVPASECFERACYSALLERRSLLEQDDILAHQLASAWLDVLEDFYAAEHLSPDEVLLDKLSSTHVLDAGYMTFRSLIRGLSLPSGLALDRFFRQSQRGRRYYGTVVDKPEWKSGVFDDTGKRWSLPSGNRYIQIEPQYNVLTQTMKVYIHYETNPYYPVRTLRARVAPEEYESYLSRREVFAQQFARVDFAPFQMRVRSNQLASADVALPGKTVSEVRHRMQDLIDVATKAIDQALTAESAI